MKLNAQQLATIERQTNARPIAEDSPELPQLVETFGDHSFYLSEQGLLILIEMTEDMEGAEPGTAALVIVAEWTNDQRENLSPIQPRPLGPVFKLDDGGGNAGA